MFTGIIEATGTVAGRREIDTDWRLAVTASDLDLGDVRKGDSIAVNGCCLTVVEANANTFAADVSQETLRCTTLGSLTTGARVNLEKALPASGRFGGHLVSGHVDGVGTLVELGGDGAGLRLTFEAPRELARYIAPKGSICVDGASLTVNEVHDSRFTVNAIPHTRDVTVIGNYTDGQRVNLEVDLIARYLERLVMAAQPKVSDAPLASRGQAV